MTKREMVIFQKWDFFVIVLYTFAINCVATVARNMPIEYICVRYCMVYTYVREDNSRGEATGLSPVHMHNHTITALLHQHVCILCAL